MGSLRFRSSVVLFMIPAFLLYGVFFIIPFVQTLYGSIFAWNGMGVSQFVGLQNYIQLAQDDLFQRGIGRVALWAVLAILFKVGIALVLASMLRVPIRGERFFSAAFFVPVVISSAAISLMFTLLYDPDIGLIDIGLRAIGLGALAQNWLSNENTALYAVIAVPIWHTIGYFFVILLAAMRNSSQEIYEAARIDGARAWMTFTRITVPTIWPVLQVCIVLAVTAALKSFDYVFVMTAGGPGTATEVPATYMYRTIFVALRLGYGTAMASTIFLIALATTLLFRRLAAAGAD
jgi:raffinose/stachyose/melibiose transport system permease protein